MTPVQTLSRVLPRHTLLLILGTLILGDDKCDFWSAARLVRSAGPAAHCGQPRTPGTPRAGKAFRVPVATPGATISTSGS